MVWVLNSATLTHRLVVEFWRLSASCLVIVLYFLILLQLTWSYTLWTEEGWVVQITDQDVTLDCDKSVTFTLLLRQVSSL